MIDIHTQKPETNSHGKSDRVLIYSGQKFIGEGFYSAGLDCFISKDQIVPRATHWVPIQEGQTQIQDLSEDRSLATLARQRIELLEKKKLFEERLTEAMAIGLMASIKFLSDSVDILLKDLYEVDLEMKKLTRKENHTP